MRGRREGPPARADPRRRARPRRHAPDPRITEHDLHEDLRQEGLEGSGKVKEARLERSGKLSVVKRSEPKVVEVRVEDGVQVVRLELG
jgi:uncharacterized membrane protein YcaP (DUF421 family)